MSKRTKKPQKTTPVMDLGAFISPNSLLLRRQEGRVAFDLNAYIDKNVTDITVDLHFNGTKHQVRLNRVR